MTNKELIQAAQDYLDANWDQILEDLERLLKIPSCASADKADFAAGMPFGPDARAALDAMMEICQRMDFATTMGDGYVALCDIEGKPVPNASLQQLGIIGHLDVVPAGPGWDFEPFALSRHDGYLVGRGILDDKGPSLITLHALKMVSQLCQPLPRSVRFIFGSGEEVGMEDVQYFLDNYPQPSFTFTPDAEFPVCNGEMGVLHGYITSGVLAESRLSQLACGTALNAVPGLASLVVTGDAAKLAELVAAANATANAAGAADTASDARTDDAAVSAASEADTGASQALELELEVDGSLRLTAHGKGAHGSTPQLGVNAIGILLAYLLDHDLCNPEERPFLEFVYAMTQAHDGSSLGIACSDEFFGPLTLTPGVLTQEDGRLVQSIDIRYPQSTTGPQLIAVLENLAAAQGGNFILSSDNPPFVVPQDSPAITAMLDAYNYVTGQGAKAFTMGGATYARKFDNAASFGMEKVDVEHPVWVGGMHGPNEAVREEDLKEAFKIYALAIWNLLHL